MSSVCSPGAIATTLVGACLWLLILFCLGIQLHYLYIQVLGPGGVVVCALGS